MSFPTTTEIEFSELDILQTQLDEILEALDDASGIVAATTDAVILTTVDPTGDTSDAAAAVVLTSITTEFGATVAASWASLKAAVDAKLAAYGLDPLP